jgi:hypothetical protein
MIANRACVFWAIVLPALAAPATAAAQAPPSAEEMLGFSRYLPEDVDGYVSLMQMGRLVRTVGESKAWAQLEATPEIKQPLDHFRALLDSGKLPPEALMALDLLRAAGESEVTVATRPDVSKNLLATVKLLLYGIGGFAPTRHDPASPEGVALAAKQTQLRQDLVNTLTSLRIPSMVVAARVRDPAKFEPFVRMAVEQGRQAMFAELKRELPPEILAKLETAFAPAQVGAASLWRFRLRLGDVLPESAIAGELRKTPLDEAQQKAVATAAANLTVDAHLGFIGEYLTLTVSSDDDFVKQIVERHEGRAKNSLAASPAFAPIRAQTAADTIGILYTDATASRTELRDSLLPLLRSYAAPEFLALAGAPEEISQVASRFTTQMEAAIASMPLKQFSVLQLEQGLRQTTQSEIDRAPAPPATAPLTTVGAIPANATGFVAWREASLDPLWDQIRMLLEQQDASYAAAQRRLADNPEFVAAFGHSRERLRAILRPISDKLIPSTRGEMAIVIGPFVEFSVAGEAGKEVPRVSIPSAALLILSPNPDQAIEGLNELFQQVVATEAPPPGRPAEALPVTFDVKTVDGIEARVLAYAKAPLGGIEPHVTKLGRGLVISSSFELTKYIREAASGRAPTIAAAPAYQAAAGELPATADQLTFIDGAALVKNIGATADQLFAFAEANAEKLRMSARDQGELIVVRRVVDAVLRFASTFRGAHSSLVSEGPTNVLKERIRFEDVTE